MAFEGLVIQMRNNLWKIPNTQYTSSSAIEGHTLLSNLIMKYLGKLILSTGHKAWLLSQNLHFTKFCIYTWSMV